MQIEVEKLKKLASAWCTSDYPFRWQLMFLLLKSKRDEELKLFSVQQLELDLRQFVCSLRGALSQVGSRML
jgi:hypothetical protein